MSKGFHAKMSTSALPYLAESNVVGDGHELRVTWPSQNRVIRMAEIHHFKGQSLHPEVGAILESDGQVDMPDWYYLLPRHDAAERGTTRSDA